MMANRSRELTAAVPLLPSDVAVIVTSPGATARTLPVLLTLAATGLELCQVIARPVSTVPLASFTVAVSCSESPNPTLAGLGVTVTLATGGTMTVIVALALLPSDVPVMLTVPAPTPCTTPSVVTVAIAGFAELQANTRPGSGASAASKADPVSAIVAPVFTVPVDGVIFTDAI